MSPSHLIYGRIIAGMQFLNLLAHTNLSLKGQHTQFTNQWRREHLREHRLQKMGSHQSNIVILKSNHAFWRLGVVESLLLGSDKKVKAKVLSAQLSIYIQLK